jgi:hypothetical protein
MGRTGETMQRAIARVDECVCAIARGATCALMVVEDRAETAAGDCGGGTGGWLDFFIHCSLGIRRRKCPLRQKDLQELKDDSRRDEDP